MAGSQLPWAAARTLLLGLFTNQLPFHLLGKMSFWLLQRDLCGWNLWVPHSIKKMPNQWGFFFFNSRECWKNNGSKLTNLGAGGLQIRRWLLASSTNQYSHDASVYHGFTKQWHLWTWKLQRQMQIHWMKTGNVISYLFYNSMRSWEGKMKIQGKQLNSKT